MKMIARASFASLFEQVAHSRGADADKHLDELGAGNRKELDPGLTGDRSGDSVLPVPGGPTRNTPLGTRPPSRL